MFFNTSNLSKEIGKNGAGKTTLMKLLLILDEPINGLDPAGIKEIRDIIFELNTKGVTFVISSHLLDELGKIATNYGIVSGGVIVEEIISAELEEKCRTSLKVTVHNAPLWAWEMTLLYLVFGVLNCINIIGIPSGIQCFKIMKLAFFPLGANIK